MNCFEKLTKETSLSQEKNEETFQSNQAFKGDGYNVFTSNALELGSRNNETNFLKIPGLWGVNIEDELNVSTNLQDPVGFGVHEEMDFESQSLLSPWVVSDDPESFKMDDVFQVEKDDLIQGPTLAELNSKDECLFDVLEFEQWSNLPEEQALLKSNSSSDNMFPAKQTKDFQCSGFVKYDTKPANVHPVSSIKCTQSKRLFSPIPSKPLEYGKGCSNIGSLYLPKSVEVKCKTSDKCFSQIFQSTNICESTLQSQQNFAVTNLKTCDSSNTSVISVDEHHSDGEMNDFFETSEKREKLIDADVEHKMIQHGKRKKLRCYFWQYNSQSKGVNKRSSYPSNFQDDPHVLNDITDPVFTKDSSLTGIRHSGKARRGDGNDLTPNPQKLYNIGLQLKQLNEEIKDLSPEAHAKPKSRKEKNKLASRVCRLKKKAQHEANKLKLSGLQKEHRTLMDVIVEVKKMIRQRIESKSGLPSLTSKVELYILHKGPEPVAGCAAELILS
ncbi:uncharacterized protein LOC106469074 [Limulus polyphemus]|uniref:Uncharacterized protein LOC106469074 n=1 Tax=Limulus polyphemus TaxID=6850 RepID=A0ABM1TBD2_LIMPO|nr:uncharacterized protein LOC106469074 [Limulus polyphemus]